MKGFAVEITRKDGTKFLGSSGSGVMPFVHPHRKWAVAHKRELANHGFKCRVVPVVYSEPRVVRLKRKK